MYKILNGLSSDIMQDIFEIKSNYYNTRNTPAFFSRNTKTVRYGLQTNSYMAPKTCDLVPKEMKQVTTLNEFKAKIKMRIVIIMIKVIIGGNIITAKIIIRIIIIMIIILLCNVLSLTLRGAKPRRHLPSQV